MHKELKSAMLLFLVTVLRLPPVENTSSIVAIVRLLSSLEPFGGSSSSNSRDSSGSKTQATCTCEERSAPPPPPPPRPSSPQQEAVTSYGVADLMTVVQQLVAQGTSAETILDMVQLELRRHKESVLSSVPNVFSQRMKHNDNEAQELLTDTRLAMEKNIKQNLQLATIPVFPPPPDPASLHRIANQGNNMENEEEQEIQYMAPPFPLGFPPTGIGLFQTRPPRDVTLVINPGLNDGAILSIAFAAPPNLSLYGAFMQAETEYDYKTDYQYDTTPGPAHVKLERDGQNNCYTIKQVGEKGSKHSHKWMVTVNDAENKEVYYGRCVPVKWKELPILPGYTIHLQYETTASANRLTFPFL